MTGGREGDGLRAARIKAGLTQEEVARRAGISVRTVRHIERGQVRNPRHDSLDRVARVVGYDRAGALAAGPGADRAAAPCEVRLLGPLTVMQAGAPVAMPQKLRTLLGLLAVQADQVVRHEEIADVLWPGDAPCGYARLVHTYAARLRRIFDMGAACRGGGGRRIGTVRGGYVFNSSGARLDLRQFEDRVARAAQAAASDPSGALDLYGQALRSRQGRVLQDVPQLWQHPAAVRIAQRHIDVTIDVADLALRLNRPGFAVEHLMTAAHEEPLNESLQARMMLALAGSGRRAAALQLFEDLRVRLRRELGVEPSDEVWQARRTILASVAPEPPMSPPPTGATSLVTVPRPPGPAPRSRPQTPQQPDGRAGSRPQAPRRPDDVRDVRDVRDEPPHQHPEPPGAAAPRSYGEPETPREPAHRSDAGARAWGGTPAGPVAHDAVPAIAPPAQLPPVAPPFVGREEQLDALDTLLECRRAQHPSVGIGVVHGPQDIGKTALAVRWAHRRHAEFSDGQLYADLQGSTGRPVPVGTVLTRFLRALGVSDAWLPDTCEEASALLRSLVAGRRFLLLLDDAADAAQVRALLPGSPGNLVLVTSRAPLMDLVTREGATPIPVDVLSAAESYALIEACLGAERTAAEPDATAELAAVCGQFPMALRTAAARLAANPHLSIRVVVAELTRAAAESLDAVHPPHGIHTSVRPEKTSEPRRAVRRNG
ncbi:BTAD domain-containing putative transcriptional regulator [Streptomyces sp. CA-251387]|uniref:BTAD domain-containing putative transcriptional regulator n=1 Tax=Streptomyces sp. CA-251387 TaxID=3240064 RepID=UPI003D8CE86A